MYDARYTRSVVVDQISMKSLISRQTRSLQLTRASAKVFTYFGCTRLPVHSLFEMEKQALLPQEAAWRRRIRAVASRLLIRCPMNLGTFVRVVSQTLQKDGERAKDVSLLTLMLMLTFTSDFCKVHATTSSFNVF